jgi:hypothetical protein
MIQDKAYDEIDRMWQRKEIENKEKSLDQMFRITKEDLEKLILQSRASNNIDLETMLGQCWKKSLKTGVFERTRIGLLREASWAKKNGMESWHQLVKIWISSLLAPSAHPSPLEQRREISPLSQTSINDLHDHIS